MGFRTGRKYAITWCKKAENYDYVKALECYDEAIKRDPTFAKPWYEKGKIFADTPELPESWMWQSTISPYITGRPAPPYPEVGPVASKYKETLKLFNKATELDPKFVNAWFAKGYFYYHYVNGEDNAIKCLDKVIALDPKFESAWFIKALVLAKLGKHKEIIKCCDKAIALLRADGELQKIDDNYYYIADRWFTKANALSALGKNKEAIECYDETIKIRDKKSPPLLRKGIILAKLGNHEEALKCYDEIIKDDPYLQNVDMEKLYLVKANTLSELHGSIEPILKCYSSAIKTCAHKLPDLNSKSVNEHSWEKTVKIINRLEEICSQAKNNLKKYHDND